ncbi:MAG: DNA polymerase III subunit beta [Streptosporangiales bacterium]
MRVQVGTADLAAAAAFAARHAATRPATPVLAGVRVTAGASDVTVTGYDYEASSVARTPAQVEEAGEVLVPGRMFAEILRMLPDSEVSVAAKDAGVYLESAGSQFTLPVLPLEDYPSVPMGASPVGQVDAKALGTAVSATARIALRDETVPLLSGICLDVEPERLTFTTTDRYRVACHHVGWQPATTTEPVSAVVPARLLAEAVRGLTGSPQLSLGLDTAEERRLTLATETAASTIRLLDGSYPDVLRKMPTSFAGRLVVERDALAAAVRRIALVADEYAAVLLELGADGVVVSASSDEDTRGRTRLAGVQEGEPETVSMNVRYLVDGLACVDGPYARLSYQQGVRPLLIEGCADAAGAEVNANALYFAMPRTLPAGRT